jgi:hypothetical protein
MKTKRRCCRCDGRKLASRPEHGGWTKYMPKRTVGKLCYHYCSKQSHLPIRDVLNDHGEGPKKEPNYETATYNWCARCNRRSVHAAIRHGLSHILFITKYTGVETIGECHKGCFIVGYYKIGQFTKVPDEKYGWRYAIKASDMRFVPIKHAYRWTVRNLRYATQRVQGRFLDKILVQLKKHDVAKKYCREVKRLNRLKCQKGKREPMPFLSRNWILRGVAS